MQTHVAGLAAQVREVNDAAMELLSILGEPDCPRITQFVEDRFERTARSLFPAVDLLFSGHAPLLSIAQIDAAREQACPSTVDESVCLGLMVEAGWRFCDHANEYIATRSPDSQGVVMAWAIMLGHVEQAMTLLGLNMDHRSVIKRLDFVADMVRIAHNARAD